MSDEQGFEVVVTRAEGQRTKLAFNFLGPKEEEPKPRPTDPREVALKRLGRISSNWAATSISFFEFVPIIGEIGHMIADRGMEAETIKFLVENARAENSQEEEGAEKTTYTLSNEHLPFFTKSLSRSAHLLKTAHTLSRSALSALISEYEAFLGEMLVVISEVQPSAFIDENSSISLNELTDYESIDEIKKSIIAQKVEDLLHQKSHREVLDWIGQKFGVNLTSDSEILADFVEICQRRHLVMHGGAKVNKRYLRICMDAGKKEDELPGLGETVTISRRYIRRSTARVFVIGFFTLHMLWQKLLPEFLEESDQAMLEVSHDFLENDLTKMARRVCAFALSRKKMSSDKIRAYLIINEAQGYLFDDRLEDEERQKGIQESLARRDWSLSDGIVNLALSMLKEEYEGFEEKLSTAKMQGLKLENVTSWNVFRKAWEKEEFIDAVSRVFDVDKESAALSAKRIDLVEALTSEEV